MVVSLNCLHEKGQILIFCCPHWQDVQALAAYSAVQDIRAAERGTCQCATDATGAENWGVSRLAFKRADLPTGRDEVGGEFDGSIGVPRDAGSR